MDSEQNFHICYYRTNGLMWGSNFGHMSHFNFLDVLDDTRVVCYMLVNTFCFLTEMHGLLSLGVRPVHIERITTLKAIRYFSKTTATLRCQVKVDKDAKSLIEKTARKTDPFSAVQNEPITKFVVQKINLKKRVSGAKVLVLFGFFQL